MSYDVGMVLASGPRRFSSQSVYDSRDNRLRFVPAGSIQCFIYIVNSDEEYVPLA